MIAAFGKHQLGILHDLVAEPDTARTHDAPLGIEHNVRTKLNAFRLPDFLEIEPADTFAVRIRIILQFTLSRFIANGTIERMIDEEEFHDRFAGIYHFRGCSLDDHAVGDQRLAGDNQLRHLLNFNETDTAIPGNG
jgi:hypothetical protein